MLQSVPGRGTMSESPGSDTQERGTDSELGRCMALRFIRDLSKLQPVIVRHAEVNYYGERTCEDPSFVPVTFNVCNDPDDRTFVETGSSPRVSRLSGRQNQRR